MYYIHHLYHICRYENTVGKIETPIKILEWGGGYGNMCKVLNMICGDAIKLLQTLPVLADVILIDPMFPERKKSAMVKGEMQFLQRFLGFDEDASHLLQAALDTGVKRVVLKRPPSADESGSLKASHSVKGKSSRFDIYLQ